MQRTLLWEAFSTFDNTDLRELAKFVRSPFFNGKPQLVGLFDYLRLCREQNTLPTPEAAFTATYPAASRTDEVKLRLANSDLLALIEHYWVYREKFADYERGKIRLAGVYRRKGLDKHFQITLREARNSRTALPWRHAEYYHDQNLLEWEQFQYAAAQKRYETFNLQEISDLLDTTYIARKLRHVCLGLSHAAVTGQAYRFGLFEELCRYVENEGLLTLPAIGLYYHACRFLAGDNTSAETDFGAFRTLLTAHSGLFPPDEVRTLYLLALNFCIKKSNTGGTSTRAWFQQTWELYREALDLQLLLENGVLSRFAFNNIVGVAVRLGHVDWAEHFIEHYTPRVERKFRAAARSLNLARVAYTRRDYSTALLLLQEADYRDLISSMSAKIIQLKIYYETDEYELLDSHLDSIKNYLRRQHGAGYHRDNYLGVVRATRALIRCNTHSTSELQALKADLENQPSLLEREWLLEQVNGLMG
jgi:hypothetical protein